MAYRIYIDGLELDESNIEGFDSIVIKRDLSSFYWGYLNSDGFGFSNADGSARITIYDQNVSAYIKHIFERDGFSANISTTIINEDTGQKVAMLVDFAEYEEIDCCFIAITLRPDGGGDLLLAREKIEYPITLSETISVPIRPLPETVDFNVSNASWDTNSGSMSHYIPLVVSEDNFTDGTSKSVEIGSQTSFFTSTSNQCVEVVGSIKMVGSSIDATDFDVYLNNGTTKILIDNFPISTDITEYTVVITEEINMINGGELSLTLEGVGAEFSFFYDDGSTGISVQSCTDQEIEYRDVRAISVREAFRQIISRSTNGTSQLGDYIFDDCEFDGYLTDNNGLVGNLSSINVSLFKLFEELNNKYPISMTLTDKVNIIARCDFLTCVEPYEIVPQDISRFINQDVLYSDVKIGYNNWRPDAIFGSIEYNSTRQYESSYSLSSNSLSLLNDWSGSSTLISEQMLKKREKDEIHWIVVDKETMVAETNEYIQSDVYLDEAAINLRITPARNLERWKPFLINDLKFASATGNSSLVTTDSYECGCFEGTGVIDESTDLKVEPIIGKFTYSITLDSCGVDINRLYGCVSFEYCNQMKIGFVSSLEYELTQGQSEQITIQVIELWNGTTL